MENRFKELQDMINECNNIVFFGGAGVSTASGIPDFRSEDGLYNGKQPYRYKPEVMLSHSFFLNNTYEFFNFYRDKMCATDYEPNITHKKLAELEEKGKLTDDLKNQKYYIPQDNKFEKGLEAYWKDIKK